MFKFVVLLFIKLYARSNILNGYKKRIYNILTVILSFGIWWVLFFKPIRKK